MTAAQLESLKAMTGFLIVDDVSFLSHATVRAGSEIRAQGLWGWTEDGPTEPFYVVVKVTRDMTATEALDVLWQAYRGRLGDAAPRELIVEDFAPDYRTKSGWTLAWGS